MTNSPQNRIPQSAKTAYADYTYCSAGVAKQHRLFRALRQESRNSTCYYAPPESEIADWGSSRTSTKQIAAALPLVFRLGSAWCRSRVPGNRVEQCHAWSSSCSTSLASTAMCRTDVDNTSLSHIRCCDAPPLSRTPCERWQVKASP